jgi:hypothetical protein
MAETKAACDLIFDHTFMGGASQTTTMTVLGQYQDASGVTADETIVVSVTAAQLGDLLTVGSQSSPGVGYPAVALNWTSVRTPLNAKYDDFVLVDGASSGLDFTDDGANLVPTLQKVFSSREFSYDASPLDSIPIEAVHAVDYSGPLSVKNSDDAEVTAKLTGITGTASLLGGEISAGSEATLGDSKQAAVRSLYLQALAADRYKQATAPAGANEPTSQAASAGFNFQTGDSLTVYTLLALTKTRRFIPKADETGVGAVGSTPGTKKFAIDGSDVVIGDIDESDDSYPSNALNHIVAWKLVVA